MTQPMPITDAEKTIVHEPAVVCDGGKGALGHPRVFLPLTAGGDIVCPYCSRVLVRASTMHGGGH